MKMTSHERIAIMFLLIEGMKQIFTDPTQKPPQEVLDRTKPALDWMREVMAQKEAVVGIGNVLPISDAELTEALLKGFELLMTVELLPDPTNEAPNTTQ